MGFLSGIGNLFGIGGSGTTAKNAGKRAQWSPPNFNLPGYSTNYIKGRGATGQDTATLGLDSANTALRSSLYGIQGQGLAGLSAPVANNGGYGGVSDQLLSEFGQANAAGANLPEAFYDSGYVQNLNNQWGDLAKSATGEAQNMLTGGTEGNMNHWLDILRQQAAPQENNLIQGNMDKQFLKGILASTAGQYQTQGMTEGLGQADLARQLQAYGMSQDAINQAMARAGEATGQWQGIEQYGSGQNFLLNQLQGNRTTDRFNRAMGMFGAGQTANQDTQQRALAQVGVGAGGISSQDQQLLNMLGLQGQLGAARSGANLGAGQIRTNYDLSQQNNAASMYNATVTAAGNAMGGMMSDRRLKTNIKQIGTTPGGYPWYSFDYIWGEEAEGVMADEVPSEWVSYTKKGYAMVDYSKVH